MKYLRYELLQKYVKDEPRDEYMKGNLVGVADTSDGCERYDRHVAEEDEWIVYKNSNLVTGDSMFASHFIVTAEDSDYIYLRNTSPITENYIGTQYSGGANKKPFGRVYKAGSLTVESSQLSGVIFDAELRQARLDLWDFISQPVLKWTFKDTYAMTDPVRFLVGIECLGAKTPVDPAQFFSNTMSNVGDTTGARTLNLSAWADKLVVSDVTQMFQLQVSLGYIDIRGWDLSNATTIDRMFWQAGTYLQEIDMSGVKVSSTIPLYSSSNKSTVFSYCQNLKKIYFGDQTSDDYDDYSYNLLLSALQNPNTSYTRPTGYTVYRTGTVPSWRTTVECAPTPIDIENMTFDDAVLLLGDDAYWMTDLDGDFEGWTLVKESDGIKYYRYPEPGTSHVVFRGFHCGWCYDAPGSYWYDDREKTSIEYGLQTWSSAREIGVCRDLSGNPYPCQNVRMSYPVLFTGSIMGMTILERLDISKMICREQIAKFEIFETVYKNTKPVSQVSEIFLPENVTVTVPKLTDYKYLFYFSVVNDFEITIHFKGYKLGNVGNGYFFYRPTTSALLKLNLVFTDCDDSFIQKFREVSMDNTVINIITS